MRQQRILWINPGCHLIHSGTLRKDGCLILDNTILCLGNIEITLVLDVALAVVVGYGEEHFHSDILWLEVPALLGESEYEESG